ncbi:Outer membrane protein beta-barrel domain-containing protein [Algoriphagus faecimaris]|uniref:Outer membrane protein beta-barrel domain-containing protein n=1 Tax=Algoriphagus faecimaris TaxID=686796 RepID=A0A1G6QDK2_9BACT|nr:porin family protein [Algoriphagus faecimaris]SDC90582.1 Outer membrane protein beta-barrel domain-containing protein [Algoriphagus faecimaris]
MRKTILLITLLTLAYASQAQKFGIGPKVGLSQTELDFKNNSVESGSGEFGYHVGLFARIDAGGFFVQPELLYTQTSGSFTFSGANPDEGTRFDANFNRLDIPVMLGFKMFKLLRIQAGPIASIDINSTLDDPVGEVSDVDFNQATIGYQAGIGLDIGNLIIDAKYEGGLSKVTENVRSFSTDNRINQWILSVGFRIF